MLTMKRFAYVEAVMEEIDGALSAAVGLHNKLLQDAINAMEKRPALTNITHQYYHDNRWHDGTVLQVTSHWISVAWDEYARGCRTDGGTFSIPTEALCAPTMKAAIEKVVADKMKVITKRSSDYVDSETSRKRAEFERLKRELGE